MKLEITSEEKQALEKQHKRERDGRIRDRIKAVLVHAEGWNQLQIAQALRIHADTVHDHLEDYKKYGKLKPENGGAQSLLSPEKTAQLIQRLECHTYAKASEICAYVKTTWGVAFSVYRFFHSAQEFREAILGFFDVTWPKIADSMINRISDNFQILKRVSSV